MISFDSFDEFPDKYFNQSDLIDWLIQCAATYNNKIARLAFQFCNENKMLEYNQQYLDHDYYTDILTFPEGRKSNPIKGDVLINVDRLVDNAKTYNQSIEHELLRLMAHGLLHLCGFRDEGDEEQEEMRQEEDNCIRMFRK